MMILRPLDSQEGREPTMQCVAALRYAVQLTRSMVDDESAARLEVWAGCCILQLFLATPASGG
jgi:diacylglycerol kinase